MAEKRSLLDDDRLSSIGSAKAAKSGGNKQGIKLFAALGLFVVAGLIFAWSQGWIFAKEEEKPPPPSAEELKQVEQQQKQIQEKIKSGAVQSGGA